MTDCRLLSKNSVDELLDKIVVAGQTILKKRPREISEKRNVRGQRANLRVIIIIRGYRAGARSKIIGELPIEKRRYVRGTRLRRVAAT